MKKVLFAILLGWLSVSAMGQTENAAGTLLSEDGSLSALEPQPMTDEAQLAATSDSILSPLPLSFWEKPTLFTAWSPFGPVGSWNIHEGLNAQIGAGVTIGWGKNNPFRGGSFFTDVSLLYAKPLSDRWTMAVGTTFSRFRFFDDTMLLGSVYGMANYQFNERLSGTIYGSYTSPFGSSSSFSKYSALSERCAEVGAELNYRFNNDIMLGIGFSVVEVLTDAASRRVLMMQNGNRTMPMR